MKTPKAKISKEKQAEYMRRYRAKKAGKTGDANLNDLLRDLLPAATEEDHIKVISAINDVIFKKVNEHLHKCYYLADTNKNSIDICLPAMEFLTSSNVQTSSIPVILRMIMDKILEIKTNNSKIADITKQVIRI